MNSEPIERTAALPVRTALAGALFFMATAAFAQATGAAASTAQPAQNQAAPQMQEAQMDEADAYDPPPLQMGDATQNLLAWQRSGEIASRTPRPIAGNVAGRSYERYIKSFEHPIPEHLGSTVTKSNGGAGGASSGAR
jgi:hypothetical protein